MSTGLPIAIDLLVEAGDWPKEDDLASLVADAVEASVKVARLRFVEGSELSVVFTDDAHVRELNARFRGKDKSTNVLSFPGASAGRDRYGPLLGDIVIAQETVAAEALAEGLPFRNHLTHLVVHGLLHLFGHDHLENAEAERMEALESSILGSLGVADPYAGSEPDSGRIH